MAAGPAGVPSNRGRAKIGLDADSRARMCRATTTERILIKKEYKLGEVEGEEEREMKKAERKRLGFYTLADAPQSFRGGRRSAESAPLSCSPVTKQFLRVPEFAVVTQQLSPSSARLQFLLR
jgi:hypothetical protein